MKKTILFLMVLGFSFSMLDVARADAPVQLALFDPVQLVDEFESVKGLRLNLIYGVNYNVTGLDIGLFNKVDMRQKGVQVGIYNNSFDMSGLQVGLINKAQWLNGVQIGLINIHTNGQREFFPIINFSF